MIDSIGYIVRSLHECGIERTREEVLSAIVDDLGGDPWLAEEAAAEICDNPVAFDNFLERMERFDRPVSLQERGPAPIEEWMTAIAQAPDIGLISTFESNWERPQGRNSRIYSETEVIFLSIISFLGGIFYFVLLAMAVGWL